MAEQDEVSLPRATLTKLIKDHMPGDMRVASDTMEMLINCCTEFIQLVSSEANEVSSRTHKATIAPEHVVKALEELGLPELLPGVMEAWGAFKEEAKASHTQKANLRKTGAESAGLTQEEQIALQQQMFAAARAASMTSADNAAAISAAYKAQLAAAGQAGGAAAAGQACAAPGVTVVPVSAAAAETGAPADAAPEIDAAPATGAAPASEGADA
mmetsp:Transcript_14711/g.36667  ORF Transcript_14711/g.36667 Transcript_14711/m.36667 type:complete len:214 (-) Transcript_14711:258-899(-)|eukprot:CAMPEP_0202866068 /NCGR_PEP_ID=MMETSP1391-20130828/7185_1 /ASSEMBLY_ACC=CAM_ASM_000867 /TAXON_ID=1034604 /ORGANISM="Chlamydomonas leiostraca, Strain SAG 11-49" /LENGTH=213 /DNA_ID=CAMNT_0049545983 /DNA_START=96 /DNA_END=737 /DNA_ORIENTATION=+